MQIRSQWEELEVFLPFDSYYDSNDLTDGEIENWEILIMDAIWGLSKEDLISEFNGGPVEHLKEYFKEVPSDGIIFHQQNWGLTFLYGHMDMAKKIPIISLMIKLAFLITKTLLQEREYP